MKSYTSNFDILYLSPLNPHIFRRPVFAKLALPRIKLVNYKVFGARIYNVFKGLERRFFKSQRWTGDYLFSAYYHDLLSYLFLIKKLRSHSLITLNTPLALSAKVLNQNIAVIVDWMDVWMWPWDEMNPLDVETVKRADAVIFWSRPFMEIMTRRLGIRRATYIPSGVDLRSFDPLRQGDRKSVRRHLGLEDKFIILYSGGLWRVGGMELQGVKKVLEAFAMFSKKVKDGVLVLQIFNYDDQLLKELKVFEISDRVMLIGKLPSFDDSVRQGLFLAADALVLPASRHPIIYYAERMKAFEYMSAANPIIAEKIPGATSALGKAALYVKLGDVEEMADAMLRLHEDRELQAELGERARQRVETQYEWSVLIPKYRDFILQVIS